MVQLINPHIIERITTQTAAGEVTINLNLKIQLEGGTFQVSDTTAQEESDDVKWEIPDIETGELISFGQKVDKS
jgi:hypothetical protein